MTLPTFQALGIEKIEGFKGAILRSCDNFQLSFEISGSSSFIRQAHNQLMRGSTTVKIDNQAVRLHIQSSAQSNPESAIFCASFTRINTPSEQPKGPT
jgi:hypothetical protein